ncbi:MAG: ferrous iron transport protein B [Chitinispirillaceae bacterium]
MNQEKKEPFFEQELRQNLKASRKNAPSIALTGNPNCGKTSLFNHLTGSHQHVGNWSGVTVEVKTGEVSRGEISTTMADLPGIYSLSAGSMDERVARDFILQEKPDVVVNVIDATNLERNLYLTVQLLEIGVRPLLAFNMWDEVQAKGIKIDTAHLSELLDLPIVTTVGKTGTNSSVLINKAFAQFESGATRYTKPLRHLPPEIEQGMDKLEESSVLKNCGVPPRWAALKLLENDSQIKELLAPLPGGKEIIAHAQQIALQIQDIMGEDTESLIAEARYGFIAGAIRETVKKNLPSRVEVSDQIDRVVTHPVWAYPLFVVFMWLLFQATFTLGQYPMGWIEHLFSALGTLFGNIMPDGVLKELVIDGILQGVGGVAVFLPNILILFFGIAIMEDSGYMARAAFIMDKVMHKAGLHGKSFIPMVMGLGCNVPAIMAARTLESPRDRIKTILLAPLISCSARLPVYVLFAGALFPRHAGNVVFLFQFVLGTMMFFGLAWLFKHTLFKGDDYPFVMELPPYRLPTMKSVLIHMWQRAEHYLKKMGGVVLVFAVLIWALGKYPVNQEVVTEYDRKIAQTESMQLSPEVMEKRIERLRTAKKSELLQHSYIGGMGKFLEPVVEPLGFDWKGAVALATGFVAKEMVVGTMGVLYNAGEEVGEGSEQLRTEIASNFSPLAGISFLVFVLLYTPCIVAFVTIVRELKSVKWSLFSLVYQMGLAYGASFLVFQTGKLLGLE